jgi:hypothetical protein
MDRKLSRVYLPQSMSAGMSRSECKARAAELAEEIEAERRRNVSEQSSDRLTPHERIRFWEKLHGAKLPRSVDHPVLAIVAADTGLTLEQIGDEQKQRISVVPPTVD